MSSNRLPVKYHGKVLMPMHNAKVRKLCKRGQARLRYDNKIGQHWVQLLREPSGSEVQDINLGIDPGSVFDGYSVVSKNCHHKNIEYINLPNKGRASIQDRKSRQSGTRRVRRSRLWHRKIRFDTRTSSKIAPSIKSKVLHRQWVIKKVLQYYPINKVIIEDVRYNHWGDNGTTGKCGSFSLVEQGKNMLYVYIKSLGIDVQLVAGYDTKERRILTYGHDTKIHGLENKGTRSFHAHCVDSFVLACDFIPVVSAELGELIVNNFRGHINYETTYLEHVWHFNRLLTRCRRKYVNKKRYFRYGKGGVKKYFTNISNKKNVCRVKPTGEHSNHPKQWIYIDNGRAEKFKTLGYAKYNGCEAYMINNPHE